YTSLVEVYFMKELKHMTEKTIEFDSLPLRFEVKEDQWILQLSKSQTRVKNIKQLGLITQPSDFFVPLRVDEEDDLLIFSFTVDPNQNKWEDLKALGRNEKLRLLRSDEHRVGKADR